MTLSAYLDTVIKTGGKDRSFTFNVNENLFRFAVKFKQTEDGFSISSVPSVSAEADIEGVGSIRLGELRDSGVFSLLLNPAKFGDIADFTKKRLKSITTPSLNPALSGIAFTSKYVDVIALSPVISPSAPLGFAVLGGNNRIFGGILHSTVNEKQLVKVGDNWMYDWNSLGCGTDTYMGVVGAKSEFEFLKATVKTSAFVQRAFDRRLGSGGTAGYDLRVGFNGGEFSFYRRLSTPSVHLKTFGERRTPSDFSNVNLSLYGKSVSYVIGFKNSLYGQPVFGGEAQQKDIVWHQSLQAGMFFVSSEFTCEFQQTTGKVVYSDYTAGMRFLGNVISFSVRNQGTEGDLRTFTDVKVRFYGSGFSCTWKNGKLNMSVSFDVLKDPHIRISINQDREVTLNARFFM